MSLAASRCPGEASVDSTIDHRWLAAACLALAGLTALIAGLFPIQYSIAIVFLFAGPHNWIEARYFLTRLPPRLGKLRPYFLIAFLGTIILVGIHAALPSIAKSGGWSTESWQIGLSLWSTGLIAWVTALVLLRSRQGPRRDWSLAIPLAWLVLSAGWLQPGLVLLSLVYLHPLVGLWILDREIFLNRRSFHRTYRRCLWLLPVLVFGLAIRYAGHSDLPTDSKIDSWLVMQAGGGQLRFVSSHFLVATHAFLESIHYGVWMIAIPLANGRVFRLRWDAMPLTRRPGARRTIVTTLLLVCLFVVFALWLAFHLDYSTTRNVYFQVALFHVLAEIPFLLRLL